MLCKGLGHFRTVICGWGCLLALMTQSLAADETPNPVADPSDGVPAPNLAATQEAIEMRYRRFEGTLQQLSEYLRKTDPARAELLVRAIGKSKEGRISDDLEHLTDLLKKDQLGDAVERQEMVVAELQSLLELLMSEARKDDLELEKKRIQDLIKDVSKLIGKETDARAETERGGNNTDLQKRQKQVSESTQDVVKKIEAHDAAKKSAKNESKSDSPGSKENPSDQPAPTEEQQPGDKPNPDSKEGDNPPVEGKEGSPDQSADKSKSKSGDKQQAKDKPAGDEKSPKPDSKNGDKGDQKKSDDPSSKPEDADQPAENQQGDSQPGKPKSSKPQPSKPSKGKSQKGKPQEGQEQDQPPPEGQDQSEQQDQSSEDEDDSQKPRDKTAGRDELQRAKQEMDRAIEELKKNNKKGASDKQDKAIAELMKAKEKLEEILRQVREEERELVLAQMEARFREMLLKQEAVYNATLAVHAVPVDNRTDRHRNRAVELAHNEDEISLLAAKALTLLKEEGSSIAFPEAVEQIHDDMLTIARRLERVDVGEITQNIEQDTIESLKEIIEAMQKELEKLKDKKQQQDQKQQQQQQQQQGLVNKLAEMKMLRSLQYRVNRRTKQLGRLVDGEQAVDADVINQLKQLSDRQAKVQKATYDLSTGKNQ